MQCKKCGMEMYPTNDEWADGFVTGFTCIYCDYEKEQEAKRNPQTPTTPTNEPNKQQGE